MVPIGLVYQPDGSLRVASSSRVGIFPSGVTTAKNSKRPSRSPKLVMAGGSVGGLLPRRGRTSQFNDALPIWIRFRDIGPAVPFRREGLSVDNRRGSGPRP